MKKLFMKYWFVLLLAVVGFSAFKTVGNYGNEIYSKKCEVKSDRPNCYLFYGIAQNSIGKNGAKNKLEVRYLIKGFPSVAHDVFIEIIDPNGQVDFLYSESHTASHRAHLCEDGCLRQYKTFYRIPKLKNGNYKLRVTFKFKYLFGTKDMISNDIPFVVEL